MKEDNTSLRQKIWQEIRVHTAASERMSTVNILIIFLIMLMVAILTIRSIPDLPPKFDKVLNYTQIFIWVCFVVEWVLRFWTAKEDETLQHYKYPRLRWMMRPSSIIDLLAISPGFFLFVDGVSNVGFALRILRLVIIARFFRFFKRSRSFYYFTELFRRHWRELMLSLSLLIIIVYVLACLLWLLEHNVNDKLSSIPNAIWWSVVSISTVGYGDVVPMTPWGKIITGVFLLLSMAFVALPGAIMAGGFIALLQEEKEKIKHHQR